MLHALYHLNSIDMEQHFGAASFRGPTRLLFSVVESKRRNHIKRTAFLAVLFAIQNLILFSAKFNCSKPLGALNTNGTIHHNAETFLYCIPGLTSGFAVSDGRGVKGAIMEQLLTGRPGRCARKSLTSATPAPGSCLAGCVTPGVGCVLWDVGAASWRGASCAASWRGASCAASWRGASCATSVCESVTSFEHKWLA